MKKKLIRALALMVVLILGSGNLTTALAHNALAESLGGTYVQFSYSDGTAIKGAKIVVQDADGEALGAGKTDSDGIYNYADYEGKAAKIIMNDGEGHLVEYDVPEETPPVTDRTPVEEDSTPEDAQAAEPSPAPAASGGMNPGTIAAAAGVVIAAVVIAVFFSRRSKQK